MSDEGASTTNVPIVVPGRPTGELPSADFGPIENLQLFDIRNGARDTAKSLLVKPTIGPAFHWRLIPGLPAEAHVKHIPAYIATYLQALKDNWGDSKPDALVRKIAIILGVSRAVITGLYKLQPQDFIVGEVGDPYLEVVEVADGNPNYAIVPRADLTAAQKQNLATALVFTATEKAVIAQVHMAAIGVPAVQGYSLMMCQHHYLSDPKSQSNKAYMVIERALWKSSTVEKWFSDDEEPIRDAMWHKVGHPILMNIKIALAQDERVADMLKTAGAGAAASRLPAVEPEMRAANSYLTLFSTVTPMFGMCNGGVDTSALVDAMEMVKAYQPGVAAGSIPRAESVPPTVTDRPSSLLYLKSILERSADMAAYCYGFYSALADQSSAMTGTAEKDSLRTSFSLKKLKDQSFASYIDGQNGYGDYLAVRNKRRQEGKFTAPRFVVA